MLFNSLAFAIFFPTVVILFFLLPYKCRWMVLLTSSLFFYGYWKIEYLLLLLFATTIDYFVAVALDKVTLRGRRQTLLAVSLISNLGILFFFKYYNFTATSVNSLAAYLGNTTRIPLIDLLLPVGISFYTFQALSYTIDVYRRHIKAERHYGIFLLYITFFPQLVAGPIERSTRLLPQFYKNHTFDYARLKSGLSLMLWGLFKKMVVADNLAGFVERIYSRPTEHFGFEIILATYAFAVQIFCDFSGYSDIAIGSALVLGFDLMRNFNQPYLARSVSDFWRRWHISLSTWFRDYLYAPLGGGHYGRKRWARNILIVFIISGLWHGSSWTFVVWGLLHAIYMIIGRILAPSWKLLITTLRIDLFPKLLTCIEIVITFNLIAFGWIFFRAADLETALILVANLSKVQPMQLAPYYIWAKLALLLIVGNIILRATLELIKVILPQKLHSLNSSAATYFSWLIQYALVIMIILFGVTKKTPFIYFQF